MASSYAYALHITLHSTLSSPGRSLFPTPQMGTRFGLVYDTDRRSGPGLLLAEAQRFFDRRGNFAVQDLICFIRWEIETIETVLRHVSKSLQSG